MAQLGDGRREEDDAPTAGAKATLSVDDQRTDGNRRNLSNVTAVGDNAMPSAVYRSHVKHFQKLMTDWDVPQTHWAGVLGVDEVADADSAQLHKKVVKLGKISATMKKLWPDADERVAWVHAKLSDGAGANMSPFKLMISGKDSDLETIVSALNDRAYPTDNTRVG